MAIEPSVIIRVLSTFVEKRCPPYGESFTDFSEDPQ